MKPKLLLVARRRYRLPLPESEQRKFDAMAGPLDVRVFASAPADAPTGDGTFRLVPPLRPRLLDGVAFHALLPFRVARELKEFRPDAVLVQGAHEAAGTLIARRLARSSTKVVLDVHGDWRTATRLYGSRARRLLNPVADRIAAWAVRRVDAVRTVSGFTSAVVRELGVEPTSTFPAFMDLDAFVTPPRPLSERPLALFVGALELYKGVDLLAAAWPDVQKRVPGAELRIVGKGPREQLLRKLDARRDRDLTPAAVAAAVDDAWCLVLPSRREGMGRVVVEALLRGRAVVGTRGGGIEELVRDGENGLLVPPDDPEALADGLVRILSDRDLAARLGAAARPSAERWITTPEQFARQLREVVEAALD